MKKILYISDLDGTLLDSEAKISEKSEQLLNKFISEGGYFTIATARTAATALKITENVMINVPVILMNGVCIYDKISKKYVHIESLPESAFVQMNEIIHSFDLSGFLFTINDGVLDTYYENISSENAIKYVEEREKKFGKIFKKTDNFMFCKNKTPVYYSVTDSYNKLQPFYEQIKNISGLHIDFYRDVYAKDYWFLEISSKKASKYNAVKYLRKNYDFEQIIGFGDNLNDLPMFEACDRAYAVANAKEQVKAAATDVILPNYQDGVALFILERKTL